jgi:selenide, water dikinase
MDPKKVLANSGARAGDALILTKAIGTGVISTAIKKEKAESAWMNSAIASMTTLNKQAAELVAGKPYRVHAMTDITGFGLIGHARELALASDVSLRISSSRIPLLDGALECVRAGYIPGGLKANRDFAECVVNYEAGIPEEVRTLLFDPQTAGGLLISVAADDADELARDLTTLGVAAIRIGEVIHATKPLIRVAS